MLVRILSLLFVAATALVLPHKTGYFKLLVVSLAFGHYFLAYVYGSRKIKELWGVGRGRLQIVAVIAASVWLHMIRLPLIFLFGFHHASNEVYAEKAPASLDTKLTRGARFILHLSLFILLSREELPASKMVLYAGLVSFSLSYVAVVGIALRKLFDSSFSGQRVALLKAVSFDLLSPSLLLLNQVYDITFLQIVLYHVVYWWFWPLPRIAEKGAFALARYVGLSFVFSTMFLPLTPLFNLPFHFSYEELLRSFYFWGTLHILGSTILSDAHPTPLKFMFGGPLRKTTAPPEHAPVLAERVRASVPD